jgi:excisionase family DNA binding protein
METTSGDAKLTVTQVCALVGLSKTSVLREIEAGEFEAYRVGPKGVSIRVKKASVDAYLARRAIKAVAA